MELVYLWVENYKNIHKQGFNFSPRFRCEYDEKTEKLEIIDKDVTGEFYPKNFFGGNVNVTAIVGENWSGKTTILKILISLIYSHSEKNKNINDVKASLIYKESDKYYQISNNLSEDIKIIGGEENKENKNLSFYAIYFNYLLDSIKSVYKENFIDELYHKVDSYNTPILLIPDKKNDVINLKEIRYNNQQIFKEQFCKDTQPRFIKEFFNPNLFNLLLNEEKIFSKIERINKITWNNPILSNKSWKDLKEDERFKNATSEKLTKKKNEDLKKELDEFFEKKELKAINNIYFALKILMKKRDSKLREELIKIVLESENIFTDLDQEIKKYDKKGILKESFDENSYEYEKRKLEQSIQFEDNILRNETKNFFKVLNQKIDLDEYRKICKFLPPWIKVEFFQDEKSYDSLSSGEKLYFSFFVNLVYQLDNIKETKKYSTINLFFDEVELSMHPNWQKKFLKDLMSIIKEYVPYLSFNIIVSSHSSFILSDLPKENVIFLEKGKQVYPFEDGKQTFGANIHTLLSHGFFMKDGLMGEFAKDKIDIAIKYLNQSKLSDEELSYCENIISIIGEPIIKRELQRKLDSKRLSKLDKIAILSSKRTRLST